MMSADMLKELNAVKAVRSASSGYFKGALTPGCPYRARNKFDPQILLTVLKHGTVTQRGKDQKLM